MGELSRRASPVAKKRREAGTIIDNYKTNLDIGPCGEPALLYSAKWICKTPEEVILMEKLADKIEHSREKAHEDLDKSAYMFPNPYDISYWGQKIKILKSISEETESSRLLELLKESKALEESVLRSAGPEDPEEWLNQRWNEFLDGMKCAHECSERLNLIEDRILCRESKLAPAYRRLYSLLVELGLSRDECAGFKKQIDRIIKPVMIKVKKEAVSAIRNST